MSILRAYTPLHQPALSILVDSRAPRAIQEQQRDLYVKVDRCKRALNNTTASFIENLLRYKMAKARQIRLSVVAFQALKRTVRSLNIECNLAQEALRKATRDLADLEDTHHLEPARIVETREEPPVALDLDSAESRFHPYIKDYS